MDENSNYRFVIHLRGVELGRFAGNPYLGKSLFAKKLKEEFNLGISSSELASYLGYKRELYFVYPALASPGSGTCEYCGSYSKLERHHWKYVVNGVAAIRYLGFKEMCRYCNSILGVKYKGDYPEWEEQEKFLRDWNIWVSSLSKEVSLEREVVEVE